MMWVFVALGALELFVVHLLVSLWSVPVALGLSLLTLAGIAWLAWLIRSFRRCPVIVEADALLLRTGTLMAMRVPLAQVSQARAHVPAEMLKRPGVLSFALLSYPNVLIDLREPVRRGRRKVGAMAHSLDDPGGFVRALNARLGVSG